MVGQGTPRVLAVLAIAPLLLGLPVAASFAATPVLTDIRFGEHAAVTRVVLDLKGHNAPFTVKLAEDGLSLTISTAAKSARSARPQRQRGLVKAVTLTDGGGATQVTIATNQPVALVAQGALPPNSLYRSYRIYVDFAAGAAPKAEGPMGAPSEPAPIDAAAPAATPMSAMAEANSAAHAEEGHSEKEGERHEDRAGKAEADADPAVTLKLGGAAERGTGGGATSAGPNLALQTGIFGDSLELETGVTPLIKHGYAEWKSGLIVKKPIELTEHVEAELGAGPLWLRKTAPDEHGDSAGIEGVAELVLWPWANHSFGWYLESGYAHDFGKGHESSVGLGAGILVGIP